MKILFLADDYPPFTNGGAAVIPALEARACAQGGDEVVVVTTVRDAKDAGSILEDGIQVERIHAPAYAPRWRAYRSLYNPRCVDAVRAIIVREKPDIVHAHNVHLYLSYATLRIAKKSGARVVLTAHDVMLFNYGKLYPKRLADGSFDYRVSSIEQIREYRFWYNPLRNLFIRFILRSVDSVIAVSDALREALAQNGIKNVRVVHNGIAVDAWRTTPAEAERFRSQYGLGQSPVILFGGRVSGAKGGDLMIKALSIILQQISDVKLVIAGSRDKYLDSLFAGMQDRSLEKQVICTGWLSPEELRMAYAASDVFVVPSQCFDSLPTMALEAMAVHKPVVGTNRGGIPEIILDGDTGFVVEASDTETFADRLIRILQDSNLARAMGERGYARVREVFSIEQHVRALRTLYAELRDAA